MENLKDFVERLAKDVGCFSHANKTNYSLQKYNSYRRGSMGVFGWIREVKRREQFEITTYRHLGDDAKVTKFADEIKPGYIYLSKNNDHDRLSEALIFYIDRGSNGDDYQKSVKALKAIMDKKI